MVVVVLPKKQNKHNAYVAQILHIGGATYTVRFALR